MSAIKQLSPSFVHIHFSNLQRRLDPFMEKSKMAACFTSQPTCFEALLLFVLLHCFFCMSLMGWILLTEENLFISSPLCVLALELDTTPPKHLDGSESVIHALQSG